MLRVGDVDVTKVPELFADGYHDDLFSFAAALRNEAVIFDGELILPNVDLIIGERPILLDCDGIRLHSDDGVEIAIRLGGNCTCPYGLNVAELWLPKLRLVDFYLNRIIFGRGLPTQ